MTLHKFDWEFIERFYPNYYSCSDIAHSDIIQRYYDNELRDDDIEGWSFIKSLGDYNDVIVFGNKLNVTIYNKAVRAYKSNR